MNEKNREKLRKARDLARAMYNILRQLPTDPGDFDPLLTAENLPVWVRQPREDGR